MFPWLHPSVVHFAVALLFTGLVLDVLGLWKQSEKLIFAGYWNTLLGATATDRRRKPGRRRSAGP